MLTIENVEIEGWKPAIRGMRNPKNSWANSDSHYCDGLLECSKTLGCDVSCKIPPFVVGPNDFELLMKLRNAGSDHRKFMRFLVVYLDITAPLYWWKEFETYRIGVYPNPSEIEMNSCSTMHKLPEKEFTRDDFSHEHLMMDERFVSQKTQDLCAPNRLLNSTIHCLNMARDAFLETGDKKYWWQMIQLLPSSYNQRRTLMVNYEVLTNIYSNPGRRYHKLDEWHTLCDWAETLPCGALITGKISD